MHSAAESKNPESISVQVQAARPAARELARLSTDQRNQILLTAADLLEKREAEILKANQQDCESLERELAAGTVSAALMKRLKNFLYRYQGHGATGTRCCPSGRSCGPRACHHGTR